MKKIVLATLLASGLMAAGNQDYFGISAGKLKSSSSAQLNPGYVLVEDTDHNAYNLTLGHYYGENGRISATYIYTNVPNTKNSDAITLGYDFILPLDKTFSVYAGPSVGYTRVKYDAGDSLSGIHYGAQAGGIVKIAKSIELEAGYKYLFETGSYTNIGGKIELDNIGLWYIGGNIRF